jgi:isopenicillin N synthase-like dioxygenase
MQELVPNFRPVMTAYYDALMELGMRLMRMLALTLDLPRDWFVDRFEKPLGSVRPIHYSGRISQPNDVRGPPYADLDPACDADPVQIVSVFFPPER